MFLPEGIDLVFSFLYLIISEILLSWILLELLVGVSSSSSTSTTMISVFSLIASHAVIVSLIAILVYFYLRFTQSRVSIPAHLSNHPVFVVKDLIPQRVASELITLIENFTDYTSNVDQSKAQGFKPRHEHIGEAQPINADGTCSHKFLFPNSDKTLCITPQRVDIGKHYIMTGGIDGTKEMYSDLVDRVSSFGRYTFIDDIDKHPPVKELFSSKKFQDNALDVCPPGKKHLDPFQFNFIINVPGQTVAVHIDSPYFWGASRLSFPQWLLVAMVFSGLFQDKFVDQVQVVGYLHQWPTGRAGAEGQGGKFGWYNNDTSLELVDPVPNSGSFVDGSKVLHAAQVYRPGVKAPHLDKNKDSVLRYVGGDQWQVLSDGEIIERYTTDDLRIAIVYRARCFKDEAEAAAYKAFDSILDLEVDILNRFKVDLVQKGMITNEQLQSMSRLDFAFFIIDSYIKYPLPPAHRSIIPFNYCAAGALYPILTPFLTPFCNVRKPASPQTQTQTQPTKQAQPQTHTHANTQPQTSKITSHSANEEKEKNLNTSFSVNPLHPLFAAEVVGIDLESINSHTHSHSQSQLTTTHEVTLDHLHDFLLATLHKYKIIVLRSQKNVTVETLRRFSQSFGELHVHLESSSHFEGFSDVNLVSNIRNITTGEFIGLYGDHVETFHSDLSYKTYPSKITILQSVIRPDGCGNTQFLDTTTAFNSLSAKQLISFTGDSIKARNCYFTLRKIDNLPEAEVEVAKQCASHPIFTKHPVTGLRNVFANPSHTYELVDNDGKRVERSDELLKELFSYVIKDAFIYEHVWKDGDIILWDNRAVQHKAMGCPETKPRKLVRTTVLSEHKPLPI